MNEWLFNTWFTENAANSLCVSEHQLLLSTSFNTKIASIEMLSFKQDHDARQTASTLLC